MNCLTPVRRCNFDGRVAFARRRAADEQRNLQTAALHFAGNVHHFFQRRSDKAAEADDIRLFLDRGFDDLVRRNHNTQVDDLVVVAAQHDSDDILADIVDIALNGGKNQLGTVFSLFRRLFFRLHERREIRYGFLHHPGALHHLREKHFAFAKKISHHVHAVHQRPLDDLQRPIVLLERFFQVRFDVIDNSLDQCMGQPLFNGFRFANHLPGPRSWPSP